MSTDSPSSSCAHCAVDESGSVPTQVQLTDTQPARSQGQGCPVCGQKGKTVDGATVKSLLAVSLRHVRDVPYYFCPTATCEVVYYSADGQQVFTTDEVRERVYQKEPDADDVLVCYCFRHTLGAIRHEAQTGEKSAIVNDIEAGIKAGQCACDWRNPQGTCCLGNVKGLVKQFAAAREGS